jgi:hypothetical protein
VRIETSALEDNPSGVRKVMEGDVQVDNTSLCTFFSTRVGTVPVGLDVEIRGLFMKLTKHPGASGAAEQTVPLIITSQPVFLRPQDAGPADETGTGTLGSMIALLAVLIVIYFAIQFVMRRRRKGAGGRAEARRHALEILGRPPRSPFDEDPEPSDKPPEPREPTQP